MTSKFGSLLDYFGETDIRKRYRGSEGDNLAGRLVQLSRITGSKLVCDDTVNRASFLWIYRVLVDIAEAHVKELVFQSPEALGSTVRRLRQRNPCRMTHLHLAWSRRRPSSRFRLHRRLCRI